MASPSTTFTEMVSTTLRNQSRSLVDNVTKHNALLRYMKANGNIKSESGGFEISLPLEHAENGSTQRYSGYDQLDTRASDVITSVKYDWCQIALHVAASGRELRINSGEEQLINLVKARVKNAMNTAANFLSVDLYSDGGATNQINGLQNLIQANGQGTVGGINSGTWSFWRNQFREMTGSGTWTKSTIKGDMNRVWLDTTRGADQPDLILSSHDFFAAYWESLQDLQRYASADTAAAGFNSLKFASADVIFDSNTNFGTTAERMYFLNTKYLYLVQHPEAQWTKDDEKRPINQDAIVVPIYWMGNLVCTNRAVQGILIDAS